MKRSRFIFTAVLAALFFTASPGFTQGNGHGEGHGHGKGHDRHDDDEGDAYYHRDEQVIRGWYYGHEDHLPPGLAKRDRLPPGLERQLVRNGVLPRGLRRRLYPCPAELERELPPPPPNCRHVLIGGHIVLLNRTTNIVVDIFHFEAL